MSSFCVYVFLISEVFLFNHLIRLEMDTLKLAHNDSDLFQVRIIHSFYPQRLGWVEGLEKQIA